MSRIALEPNSLGSGVFTIASPNSNTSRTLNLPDNTGTVITTGSTFAGTGPAFLSVLTSNQTINHNTVTKLTLNTEVIDTNNCYDPTTNYRFTPNVAGYYQITTQVVFNATATRNYLFAAFIYKNGSSLSNATANLSITVGSGSDNTVPVSTLVFMNGTTDYLEVYVYHFDYTSSASANAKNAGTFFNGSLVRAA
jgi:hypothetical protein